MLHCWNLLQHTEKWVHKNGECPTKRTKSSNSSTPKFDFEKEEEDDEKMVEVPLLARLLQGRGLQVGSKRKRG
uniref:Uncharacterized protein n=1 Tax=Arundo donax TaxID=35708 RepID=A0A0A8ZC49_ARUDO